LSQGVCHDQWACNQSPPYGSNGANYWSADLFDGTWSTDAGAPIYATLYSWVQVRQTSGQIGVRYGSTTSGAGTGHYNGHGRLGSIPSGVTPNTVVQPGQVIMKMGNTGTTDAHLHYEIRQMANVNTWESAFNGLCAKHFINKVMQNQNPYPFTLAWSSGYGGFNSCKGLVS
jgi:murein DD-endopeptidase MepM/ murein hydrolase activator NlpD